jgi:hypothetical protein
MKLEALYAQALNRSDLSQPKKVLEALNRSLKRRGHEKLLPRIFSEYQKLVLHKERLEMHNATTPESERTRTLVSLYRKLVAAK